MISNFGHIPPMIMELAAISMYNVVTTLVPSFLLALYSCRCNVGRHANKPRQWKSMLTLQGWFNLLYMQPLLVSHTTEFEICISIYSSDFAPSHYFPSEKSRPGTWPGNYMGKATPVWQLAFSHRCHQM